MAFLKEDGSLDIERINNLPYEDYMDAIGDLTNEQVNEYYNNENSLAESSNPILPIQVDYDFDDKRSGGDIDEYLSKMRKKIGIKK